MPNFIDDRHMGLLAYIGNKARQGKLKDVNITVNDVDIIIAAIQDRDRVIKELQAMNKARGKLLNFVTSIAEQKLS
jgi:hypothetical protein|tara:strand:+ start:279 stop:506 length:228 start_codon:yes stop_codon:yes gene_type:complete